MAAGPLAVNAKTHEEGPTETLANLPLPQARRVPFTGLTVRLLCGMPMPACTSVALYPG